MADLHDRARATGLQIDWRDANGRDQRVSDDALADLLSALGENTAPGPASFVSGDLGDCIPLPKIDANTAELLLESGRTHRIAIHRSADGPWIDPVSEIGYHELRLSDRTIRLAVAPARGRRVDEITGKPRIWGPAVQIPSLRDRRATSHGDFTTLADTARLMAGAGADALAISPVHALFPADPGRFSPYAPSSRLFLNVLLADPSIVTGTPAPTADMGALIDWGNANPQRMAALREAFTCRERFADDIAAFVERGGGELERHARFDALFAHFWGEGSWGWRQWPDAYRDPAGPQVEAFARAHREEVDFYLFAQWLAAKGLDDAQQAAKRGGMGLGLIADLAVGMDSSGSHAWSRRDELLTGLSIGAPPDILGPNGQNWGITGFRPDALLATGFDAFIATIRAALDHAGGIRIDHALGLRRLWVIPEGADATRGAYLTYPLDHMLRILAIESHRANALVIGEDLGTVPDGLRPALEERAILGMRVLWFEKHNDRFIPPTDWQPQAVAMTGTHDLATVAGWWSGRDIDWTWTLGRASQAPSEHEERNWRAHDRWMFWQAMTQAKVADGNMPAPDEPDRVVDAACAYVARTPCDIAILPMEDIIGSIEAPNLPGTIDEHPNWRRRMPETTDALLGRSDVMTRIGRVNEARR